MLTFVPAFSIKLKLRLRKSVVPSQPHTNFLSRSVFLSPTVSPLERDMFLDQHHGELSLELAFSGLLSLVSVSCSCPSLLGRHFFFVTTKKMLMTAHIVGWLVRAVSTRPSTLSLAPVVLNLKKLMTISRFIVRLGRL